MAPLVAPVDHVRQGAGSTASQAITYEATAQQRGKHQQPPREAPVKMPLAQRRYSVPYSKSVRNLEPPYGIEP